jgi:hypothetical protein
VKIIKLTKIGIIKQFDIERKEQLDIRNILKCSAYGIFRKVRARESWKFKPGALI